MAMLLKSLKSLKSLKGPHVAQAEDSDVTETPSDPSVKQAEAHLQDVSPCSSYQGSSPASNVVQTPTCPEAADAVAEMSPAEARPLAPSLLSSFSRKAQKPRQSVDFSGLEPEPRQKSLYNMKSAPARRPSARWLTSSKSSPNLLAPAPSEPVVLGRECRSRRRLTAGDENAASATVPAISDLKCSAPKPPTKVLERKSSSTAALYQLVTPLPSPFLGQPLIADNTIGQDTVGKEAGADAAQTCAQPQPQLAIARPSSPSGPGLQRRRLSRKYSATGKIVLSTEPLQENKGDIMLPPQVVDFAADALASMGGTYTGEIEFSGGSARALRRLSRHTSQDEDLASRTTQLAPKAEIAAA